MKKMAATEWLIIFLSGSVFGFIFLINYLKYQQKLSILNTQLQQLNQELEKTKKEKKEEIERIKNLLNSRLTTESAEKIASPEIKTATKSFYPKNEK